MKILIDTSSAIKSKESGRLPKMDDISVTPGIREEFDRHRAEIPEVIYDGVKTVVSRDHPYFQRCLNMARTAATEAMSGKKLTRDPISEQDLELMAYALAVAREGRQVRVYSEDEHIKGTFRYLLKNYCKHLTGRLDVGSVLDVSF